MFTSVCVKSVCAFSSSTFFLLLFVQGSLGAGTFCPFQNAIGVSRHSIEVLQRHFRCTSPWMSAKWDSGITFAEFQPAMRAGAGGHGFPLVCIQRVSSGVSLGFHVEPDSKANGLPCRRRARSTFDSALIVLTGRPATMRKCGFSVMIISMLQ